MKYNLHNQYVVNENVLPPRSNYTPFSDTNFSLVRTKSKEFHLLSKWKFQYFPCFEDELVKFEPTKEDVVPFNWQRRGYDYDQYLNTALPFPIEPPYILKDNPCGIYVTNYKVISKKGKYYLNFDGVDSCLYLFVNDEYVGYATISHVVNEFDITNYLNEGDNKIKVIVLKWCSGSYLEDQDKPRMSGIFREVYILNRPEDHIVDYRIESNMDGEIHFECDKEAEVTLYDQDKVLSSQVGKELTFVVKNPILWNAEDPYLYRLVIHYNGEYFEEKVGLRSVDIKDCVFRLNKTPFKIRGVNRHSATVNGYVETLEDLEKDIKLYKKFNINAVRTSHYPPLYGFTKLCDEYGLYVMLEADLETHEAAYYKGSNENFSDFSENKNYEEAYYQRIMRAFQMEKNRTSVIMWSLGNESGYSSSDEGYSNFTRIGNYIKEHDARPIHYESTILPWTDGEWYFRKEHVLSFYSRMYPPFRDIDRYFGGFYTKNHLDMEHRPFILCEYAFAAGNGSGDVKYFWDHYINKIPEFVGGFIWGWCDFGVMKDGKYLTGDDFHTVISSGNDCSYGLVDLDRSFLHSSLYEVGEAYSAFDVRNENNKFIIKNMHDFETLDKYQCKYQIKVNGEIKEERVLDIKGIKAKEERAFVIDEVNKYEGYVTIDFLLSDSRYDINSVRQVIIKDKYPLEEFKESKLDFKNNRVELNHASYDFDKNGLIKQIKVNDKVLLDSPMEICVYRAPTDNDVFEDKKWKQYYLHKASFRAISFKQEGNQLIAEGFVGFEYRVPVCKSKIIYTFDKDSKVKVEIIADINECIPPLPRFGVRFTLKKEFENVLYFGAGEIESYEDKHAASPVGLYKSSVDKMYVPYRRPQESGAHVFSRLVEIDNSYNHLKVTSESNFSFNVSKYDLYNLPFHSFELKESGHIYLNIDYRNNAIGSMAVNHPLNEPYTYTFTEKHLEFSFILDVK